MANDLPYTKEQIAQMKNREDAIRAEAELRSYIACKKNELEAITQKASYDSNAYPQNKPGPVRRPPTFTKTARPSFPPYLRPARYQNESLRSESHRSIGAKDHQKHVADKALCQEFTWTGICSNKKWCPNLHDLDKRAVCKSILFKGECVNGDDCSLSHQLSAHNTPHCQFFQAGRCNKDDCRFLHVRVNPAAPNCRDFGTMGYCYKGTTCAERHADECPFFANGGCMWDNKCRYKHILRASRMRLAPQAHSDPVTRPTVNAKLPQRSIANSAQDTTHGGLHEPTLAEDSTESAHQSTFMGGDNPTVVQDVARLLFHHFIQQSDYIPLDEAE